MPRYAKLLHFRVNPKVPQTWWASQDADLQDQKQTWKTSTSVLWLHFLLLGNASPSRPLVFLELLGAKVCQESEVLGGGPSHLCQSLLGTTSVVPSPIPSLCRCLSSESRSKLMQGIQDSKLKRNRQSEDHETYLSFFLSFLISFFLPSFLPFLPSFLPFFLSFYVYWIDLTSFINFIISWHNVIEQLKIIETLASESHERRSARGLSEAVGTWAQC